LKDRRNKEKSLKAEMRLSWEGREEEEEVMMRREERKKMNSGGRGVYIPER